MHYAGGCHFFCLKESFFLPGNCRTGSLAGEQMEQILTFMQTYEADTASARSPIHPS